MNNVVEISHALPEGWVECVERAVFGGEGARYRRLHVGAQLRRLAQPLYLYVRDQSAVVGAYVLDRRQLQWGDRELAGYYRALLVVDAAHRGQGLGALLVKRAVDWINAEALNAGQPALSFGCVDAASLAPLTVLNDAGGHRSVGGLHSILCYRQWPREAAALACVSARDERLEASEALAMGEYSVMDVTPSTLPGALWQPQADVCLSARLSINTVALSDLGTATRLLARTMAASFSGVRRRFDPDRFSYVRLGRLSVAAGQEAQFGRFLSAVLADYDLHYAMLMLDPGSDLYQRLQAAGQLRGMTTGKPQAFELLASWHGAPGSGDVITRPPGSHHLTPVDI